MLTPGFVEYSREERRRVVADLQRVEARARELRVQLEALNALLGNQAGDDTAYRGAALRVEIVAALERLNGGPAHYKAIHDEVIRGGARVAGIDPEATLLTNLTRCTGVVRTASGVYQLVVEAAS